MTPRPHSPRLPAAPWRALSPQAQKLVRGSIVFAVSLLYLSHVFQLSDTNFRDAGLGDWMDPYFINALLEHWYRSATSLADFSSPPMYFPVRGTLGYSHGLVLYAPFYVVIRPALHPFQAYTVTLFLVLETGIVCLYLLLRRLGLSFTESLSLCALFFSSQNVVNAEAGVWSQRESVFLIPPILLSLQVSRRMRDGRGKLMLTCLSGLLASLVFTQDFHTAHFAMFLSAVAVAAVVLVEGGVNGRERIQAFWRNQSPISRAALAVAALALAWAWSVWMSGGGELQLLGVRLRSHDWRRPALIALAALAGFVALRGRIRIAPGHVRAHSWVLALCLGAGAGAFVFLWMYLGAYREHSGFPEEHLVNALGARDPSRWSSLLDVARDLDPYQSRRSFELVGVLGILSLVPWFGLDRRARRYFLWLLAVSFLVLLIPLRFPEFSVWRSFLAPLPGFSVIRDPSRIIPVYELGVVLALGLLLTRLPATSAYRLAALVLLLSSLTRERNTDAFGYHRPIEVYERWVSAPIDVDPSCRSFFIRGASGDYMSRSGHMWTLYGIDSLFVSLNHSIPTLNGYSAWSPKDWALHNPQDAGYSERVTQWIDRYGLRDVCELDIDARTMKAAVRKAR